MASKKQKSPNDGTVYGKNGVFYKFPQGETGPVQINVDFALVPPPQSYYYADAIDLRVDNDLFMAILSFGRREIGTDRFADRIDIVMPAASLFRRFWLSSRDVEGVVDQVMKVLGESSEVAPASAGTSLAMTFFANMIFIAAGDGESLLDFYYLSPRDVHLAKTRKLDIQVIPSMRVILSTVMTKYFFELLKPHVQETQASQLTEERRGRATASR